MGVVSGMVLFAVVWFMVLFVVLPIRLETQGDVGEKVEGTHAGSPSSSFSMRKRLRITTYWAIPIWAIIAGVIVFGDITVRDIDMFNRMGPASGE
ncbi:MAG: DUF1467 family protein [Paracoccaceae bacterium]|nr:DUF1467 family protein [Paracoccaceae bacterium]